jgi:hypothetical protein
MRLFLIILLIVHIKCNRVTDGLVFRYVFDEHQDKSKTLEEHQQTTMRTNDEIGLGAGDFIRKPITKWNEKGIGLVFNGTDFNSNLGGVALVRGESENVMTFARTLLQTTNQYAIEIWYKTYEISLTTAPVSLTCFDTMSSTQRSVTSVQITCEPPNTFSSSYSIGHSTSSYTRLTYMSDSFGCQDTIFPILYINSFSRQTVPDYEAFDTRINLPSCDNMVVSLEDVRM